MFTYRCPGCGKHHSVDKDFEQTFEAKCLRCGALISVTEGLVHQSQAAARPSRSQAITKSPADSAVRVAAKNGLVAEAESDEPALDALTLPDDEPAPDTESRENGRGKSKEQTKGKEPKPRKKPAKRADKQEAENEEEEEEAASERKRSTQPVQSPPAANGPRPRWQVIAAIAAVVLVLGGTGSYFIFGGKKPHPKRVARSPKPAPKPTTKTKPKVVTRKEEPPIKTPDKPELILSAPRLSAELEANADIANSKYRGKLLEVSGLLSKIEKKEGLYPPSHPHAVFASSGAPVSCDLQGSPTPLAAWNNLRPNQPMTMRGKYEKNGYFRDCFLMPQYTSTADSRYKAKTIEVSGRVTRIAPSTKSEPFPTVVMEGGTNSVMKVHCLFRTSDEEEVRKIQRGSLLTIQGKCGGREVVRNSSNVRLDNCHLVYTSAPPDNMPRVEAVRLVHEYEEDTRPDYVPPPGEEEEINTVWTIRQLVKDYSADPKAFLKKYRNRILRVRGKSQQLDGRVGSAVVVLTSGDTDLTFQVECHFGPSVLEASRQRREPEYRIRGLFAGQINGTHLRLDNCQLDMPRVARPELTADYLPHKPGRSFAVDVASFRVLVNGKLSDVVQREFHVQNKDGLTEILVTHAGSLLGKSLFEEGVQQKWIQQKNVRIRTPGTAGIYFRRLKAGFVEFGTPYLGQNGKTEITWIPTLKLDARVGDKWKWDLPTGLHEYVLEKFEDFQGQPCASSAKSSHRAATFCIPLKPFTSTRKASARCNAINGNSWTSAATRNCFRR